MSREQHLRIRTAAVVWLAGIGATATALTSCAPDTPPDPAALFASNCAVCHGPAGGGIEERGPSLLDDAMLLAALGDEEIATAIREGVPSSQDRWAPMPGFPRFDDAEVAAVVGYVRELQRRAALSSDEGGGGA